MTVAIDYSQRFYFVVSNRDGVVKLIERGDAGPDLLRRKKNEAEYIGIRSIETEAFERLFRVVSNVSGADIFHKWTEANHWPTTAEAREVIDRVLYLADSIAYLRHVAATRDPKEALDAARQTRKSFNDDVKFAFSRRIR